MIELFSRNRYAVAVLLALTACGLITGCEQKSAGGGAANVTRQNFAGDPSKMPPQVAEMLKKSEKAPANPAAGAVPAATGTAPTTAGDKAGK